jgi:type IV secretory pathway VirB3-like protein
VSEFRWSNFFLGTDFALAGVSAGLLNFVDMLEAKDITEVVWKIVWTVGYLAITLGIYMMVLCMHQNIEKRQAVADEKHWTAKASGGAAATSKRIFVGTRMGMLANFIGLGPSFLFTYWKLKGTL